MFQMTRGVVLVAVVVLAGCSAMRPEKNGTNEAQMGQGQLHAKSDTTQNMTGSGERSGNGETSGKDEKSDVEEETSDRDGGQETTARGDERVDEVVFGTQRLALTEALGKAQERVDMQKEKIAGLEKELSDLRSELKGVRREKDNLEGRLATYKKQTAEFEEAMSKWKKDVLGFRDEMRESEKAEMQALKQIIILLRKASSNTEDVSEESEAPEEAETNGENSKGGAQ